MRQQCWGEIKVNMVESHWIIMAWHQCLMCTYLTWSTDPGLGQEKLSRLRGSLLADSCCRRYLAWLCLVASPPPGSPGQGRVSPQYTAWILHHNHHHTAPPFQTVETSPLHFPPKLIQLLWLVERSSGDVEWLGWRAGGLVVLLADAGQGGHGRAFSEAK